MCDGLVIDDLGDVTDVVEKLVDGRSASFSYEATNFALFLNSSSKSSVSLPNVEISLKDHVLRPRTEEGEDGAIDRKDAFFGFLGDLYEHLVENDRPPVYVYGLDYVEPNAVADPENARHIDPDQLLDGQAPGVYWFQILPPVMVDQLGEEALLSVPAFRVEKRSDGAVLIATDSAVSTVTHESSAQTVSEHLGVPYERPPPS